MHLRCLALVALLGIGCATPAPRHDVLFGGDTALGESYADSRRMLERRGYDASFERMGPLLASADLVIANLETPITDVEISPQQGRRRWLHKADMEQTPAALERQRIRAVSLANNHALDYGHEGLEETVAILSERGIASFGAGVDLPSARRPFEHDVEVGEAGLRLAVFAGHAYRPAIDRAFGTYARVGSGGVNGIGEHVLVDLRRYRKAHPGAWIVVFPHWGANYQWRNKAQRRWAHRMIDAGADLVLGHGSHTLQEIERYRDRWIVYGLGNLVFNSPGRYERRAAPPFSLVAALRFDTADPAGGRLTLYPLFSDNRITGYRPRPVTDAEFERVRTLLVERSSRALAEAMRPGRDAIGAYLELELP